MSKESTDLGIVTDTGSMRYEAEEFSWLEQDQDYFDKPEAKYKLKQYNIVNESRRHHWMSWIKEFSTLFFHFELLLKILLSFKGQISGAAAADVH